MCCHNCESWGVEDQGDSCGKAFWDCNVPEKLRVRRGQRNRAWRHAIVWMLMSPSAGHGSSFSELLGVLLSAPLLRAALSTKVLFLQDDFPAITLTLKTTPHPCLVNRRCKGTVCLGQLGMLVKAWPLHTAVRFASWACCPHRCWSQGYS